MKIRDARAEDSPALRVLVVALQAAEADSNPYVLDGDLMADSYVRQLLEGDPDVPGRVLVAELDDARVVGYVAVQPHVPQEEAHEVRYTYAYVSDIVVLPGHRGEGVGRALLSAAEHYSVSQGAKLLRLGVLAGNADARRLYASCGYGERELLLEKSLDG